ncbi:MAG: DUF1616 domain-containing protein [Solirubrobacterales bacterium]
MKGQRDLRAVAWLATLCAVLGLLVPITAISLFFAAPLALILPGYAITSAAFARRQLGWSQLLLLSIALSLSVLVLGSVLLNYVPGGIRAFSWALLLVIVVLYGCRVAAVRRRGSTALPRRPRLRLRRLEAGLLLGGLAAAIVAVALSATSVPAGDAIGYTQLWILPAAGTDGSRVQVGVRSEEQHTAAFDLRVKLGGVASGQKLAPPSFTLSPGELHVVTVGPPAAPPGTRIPVIATLLRHSRPFDVYRRVKGWLIVPPARR